MSVKNLDNNNDNSDKLPGLPSWDDNEFTPEDGTRDFKWYVLHTYSGYENKVAADILTLVENRKLKHLIREAIVPTGTKTVMREEFVKDGTTRKKIKKVIEKESVVKFFPGYVYVEMIMTEETWYICRNTRGVTGFVGPGSKPVPLSKSEVASLNLIKFPVEPPFAVNEIVKFRNLFEGQTGRVVEVQSEESKIIVAVFIMGREMNIAVGYNDVDKIDKN